ncbi:hypothetical protein C8R43DRAFT_954264 [Mycena crocata]|nr:hypothetical protein C8R43DRAFT_954264 [Mycena crocata]
MLCYSCEHPLLPSGALPTPSQTLELRNFLRSLGAPLDPSYYHSQIAAAGATLSKYDTEIEQLQQTLQGMLSERSKLQDYVDGCRAALSPVRRLPPEILCEIFAPFSQSLRHSWHSDPGSFRPEAAGIAKLELLELSKVCSRWHRLIMGTPRFWSDVALNFASWPGEPQDTLLLHLLKTFLDRGAHYPLTLSMRLTRYPQSAQQAALRLLAEHCQRWKHICFIGYLTCLQEISCIRGKLDILETLSFDLLHEGGAEDIHLFEIAPKLTRVLFDPDSMRCPKLPWNQLSSFTFQGGSIAGIESSIPTLMHELSHPQAAFEFRSFGEWLPNISEVPQITATITSFLVDMALDLIENIDDAEESLGRLMNCLTLPRLCIFSVQAEADAVRWPMQQFESLSLRSSFQDTLRVLEIPGVMITEDDLISSLASCTSLERLVISDQRMHIHEIPDHILITDTLLQRLTLRSNSSDFRIVPRLKHFVCTSFFMFSAQVYLDLVVSRIGLVGVPFYCVLSNLEDILLEFDHEVHQKLFDLVAKGELQFHLDRCICSEAVATASEPSSTAILPLCPSALVCTENAPGILRNHGLP